MHPFLEIPIAITNVEKLEKLTTCRMKPGEISYYYPGFHDGTVIVLKSGDCLFTTLTYDQVDAAIKAYKAYIEKNPGQFGNLEMTASNPKPEKPKLYVSD
jgi:hypothetical protein